MSVASGTPSDDDVARDRPLYGASFSAAVGRFFRNYAVFTGRASRSEFWWAALFQFIVGTIAGVVISIVLIVVVIVAFAAAERPDSLETGVTVALLSTLVIVVGLTVTTLPLLIPSIAVTVRRLHDTNRSGWWYLLSLIPYAGYVIYVFAALETDPAGSRFDAQRPSDVGGSAAGEAAADATTTTR